MTGKERFEAAMARQAVDRPPFDFWSETVTIERLFAYLGHRNLDRFLDDMQVDIRSADAIYPPETHLGGGLYRNYWGERYVYRTLEWGTMRDDVDGELCNAQSLADLQNHPWPQNDDFDYGTLRTQCIAIRAKSCAVRYGQADIWQRPGLVRGMQNTMVDMYDNPEWTHWLSRTFADFYKEDYRRAWEESGGAIDLFTIYSDVGSQRGPLISRAMFQEFVAPYLKGLIDVIHSFGAKALYHSCGDVSSFIPDMVEAGVDLLDPLQPVNASMQPEALAQYKEVICFHGGMDVQNLLPTAAAEEIRDTAHRYFQLLGPGWVMGPTHFFQPDIPPQNIIATYHAFAAEPESSH